MRSLVQNGADVNYPFIAERLRDSGASPGMDLGTLDELLSPYVPEMVQWSLRELAAFYRDAGIPAVAVYKPTTIEHDGLDVERHDTIVRWAAEAGLPVFEMQNPFESVADIKTIEVAPWDSHPNAEGHRLMAERLYELMMREPVEFRLEPPVAGRRP